MARRRVLALGLAMSRMMCIQNPYQKMKNDEAQPSKRTWMWSRMKSLKPGGCEKTPRLRMGLRVARLRIRMLSPLTVLKRLCDSYVRMMLSLENEVGFAGIHCFSGTAFPMYLMQPPRRMGMACDLTQNVRWC
uniref:Uncharacterized protein n=1 Tax=Physcomitrium patens TaxID=3218 RepID=A9SC46_PHYPA|nr:hypothetical protein PHYPA_007465 [Physcomitrium patens]